MISKLLIFYKNISTLIKNTLTSIEKYKEAVTLFATVIVAVMAIVSWWQTHLILGQQRQEELIQNRAYVSIEDMKFELNTDKNSEFSHIVTIIYKNDGNTPAESVAIKSYNLLDGEKIERQNDEFDVEDQILIGPNQKKIYRIPIHKEKFSVIKKENGNFWVLEARYMDYNNNKHTYIRKIRSEEINTGEYMPTIFSEEEFDGWED